MIRSFLLLTLLALAGCGNADIRRDPYDPCRAIVRKVWGPDTPDGVSVQIEGCRPETPK